MNPEDRRRTARIDQISALARTSWIGLLAYLAFIFVTLLGVEDADFFVPSRQTQLPLVNVSIPTASFFIFAPVLGAALYVYLHLFLIKLWDAIAEAPATIRTDPERERIPLSEAIHPWLANDLATAMRGNGARPDPDRPLRWLSTLVTWALVWLAGPMILAGFWWRSMPAHNEGLTLLIALCLFTATIAGSVSWYRARARLKGREPALWRRLGRWTATAAFALALLLVSWIRTEGGLEHWVGRGVDQNDTIFKTSIFKNCDPDDAGDVPVDCLDRNGEEWPPDILQERRIVARYIATDDFTFTEEDWPLAIWLDDENEYAENSWNPLARTELSGDALGATPSGWLDHDIARRRARETWCGARDIPLEACDLVGSDMPAAAEIWCEGRPDANGCTSRFESLVARFDEEWRVDRAAYLNDLSPHDLAGRDLRDADLSGAFLAGADLRRARLEGADLGWARMEGANLSQARMEGANLRGARMEKANLVNARIEGTTLSAARMEGANLTGARMEGADLTGARMEGAVLLLARMEGAELFLARMKGVALRAARMEGAVLWFADLRSADWTDVETGALAISADLRGAIGLKQAQLDRMIGNAETLLPETLEDGSVPSIPSCWATRPAFFDEMLSRMAGADTRSILERMFLTTFLCPEGAEATRTGTPLALDAPYPDGHLLAGRRD